jgi:nicotinamide-nucleotide amidase
MAGSLAPLRIELISTGNELLDGTTHDSNVERLARTLRTYGMRITRTTVVPDDRYEMSVAITDAIGRSQIVFVCGGLGPTTDDITLEVAGKALGSKLVKNKDAEANVRRRLKNYPKRKMNKGNQKQFLIPQGAKALRNDEGTAPGVIWPIGDKELIFLPGPPIEFQYILDRSLKSWLQKKRVGGRKYLFYMKIFGYPESELNEIMKKVKLPSGVELGFRLHRPEIHLKFEVSASSQTAAAKKINPVLKKLRKKLGSAVFTESEDSFEVSVLNSFLKQKTKVAIAESCTGGLTSALLTRVSGSSKVLDRAFITYSNQAKVDQIAVDSKKLEKHGAVSKWTAIAMAKGALSNSKAKKAVAITGVAGPTGGSKEKPVGTVWIAAAKKNKVDVKLCQFGKSRRLNQALAAYTALIMLRDI